jgi:Ca2+/Na+ antiporter
LSILSKEYKQIESRINIGSENLSNETILALVTSTPESSSNAMDKDIEIKNFMNLQ